MEGAELKEGRQRVADLLIEPLTRKGMIRPAGMKADAFGAMCETLKSRLAYMSPDKLQALAEVVEVNATGKARNRWPREVTVCNWAWRLQRPPASVSRLVRSYLQSEAGKAAARGGYLVELFEHLREFGVPLNEFTWSQIRAAADENRAKVKRIARAEELGRASLAAIQWRRDYMETRRRCLAIVNASEVAA